VVAKIDGPKQGPDRKWNYLVKLGEVEPNNGLKLGDSMISRDFYRSGKRAATAPLINLRFTMPKSGLVTATATTRGGFLVVRNSHYPD
jgi:hypothetical protein